MAYLTQQISSLEDADAVEAVDYVTKWVKYEVQKKGKMPAKILEEIADEQAATEILSEMFPELSGPLHETLAADESQKEQIARNYLLFLAEDERYAPKVQEALNRPSTKFEPLTTIAIASGVVFLLSLKFDIEYVNVKRHVRLRIAREPTPVNIVGKIIGLVP